ncbi:MAG: DUF4368 domain-containing protein [Eubacterium sp.]|nr:DUF4368 domain-containing protein [Eubacterium sp.]
MRSFIKPSICTAPVFHAPDKSSGHRRQKIDIYYKAIGMINIADEEDLVAVDGRGKWRAAKETA